MCLQPRRDVRQDLGSFDLQKQIFVEGVVVVCPLSPTLEVDRRREVVRSEMHDGVIHSNERMTYTDVSAILIGRDPARRRGRRTWRERLLLLFSGSLACALLLTAGSLAYVYTKYSKLSRVALGSVLSAQEDNNAAQNFLLVGVDSAAELRSLLLNEHIRFLVVARQRAEPLLPALGEIVESRRSFGDFELLTIRPPV